MHSSPFRIDVGDLLSHPGETRSVAFSGSVAAEVAQARVAGTVDIGARLEGLTDGVYMVAKAEVPVIVTCNRCLTDWEEDLGIEVRQLFAREPDEDGYGVVEHWIDTEGLIHDEVMLALPVAPVCRQDCEGICAMCGADLNTAPCGGHEDGESSPFAGLKDLLSD